MDHDMSSYSILLEIYVKVKVKVKIKVKELVTVNNLSK